MMLKNHTNLNPLMKSIAKISACLVLFAVFTSDSFGATTFTKEFWISTNTVTGDLGTLDDPYDGSTATKFDARMAAMPENCTVHILAGTYQTAGYQNTGDWVVKHGEHIIGSGIDVTTIHLARTNQYTTAIITPWETTAGGYELSDLTVDLSGTVDTSAVLLQGINSAVRRVKVVNVTSSGPELWPIGIGQGIVEDCEVSKFIGGSCSAIAVFFEDYTVFRNNRVYLQNTGNTQTNGNPFAFNVASSRNVLIEGNYVNYAACGVYSDAASNTNLTIVNNTFANCDHALALLNHPHQNITFCFNTIKSPNETNTYWAIWFATTGGGVSIYHTNVLIAGNTFAFDSTLGSPVHVIVSGTIVGLTVVNNAIDSRYSETSGDLAGDTGVNIYNNTDLFGIASPIFNEIIPPNSLTRHTISANYSAAYADRYIGVQTTNACTITLPSAVGFAGKEFIVANETSGSAGITVNPTSPDKINGSTTYTFTAGYSGRSVISDGANWFAR